jgi:hypothetical protein
MSDNGTPRPSTNRWRLLPFFFPFGRVRSDLQIDRVVGRVGIEGWPARRSGSASGRSVSETFFGVAGESGSSLNRIALLECCEVLAHRATRNLSLVPARTSPASSSPGQTAVPTSCGAAPSITGNDSALTWLQAGRCGRQGWRPAQARRAEALRESCASILSHAESGELTVERVLPPPLEMRHPVDALASAMSARASDSDVVTAAARTKPGRTRDCDPHDVAEFLSGSESYERS